jgi:hypothetical protein
LARRANKHHDDFSNVRWGNRWIVATDNGFDRDTLIATKLNPKTLSLLGEAPGGERQGSIS